MPSGVEAWSSLLGPCSCPFQLILHPPFHCFQSQELTSKGFITRLPGVVQEGSLEGKQKLEGGQGAYSPGPS